MSKEPSYIQALRALWNRRQEPRLLKEVEYRENEIRRLERLLSREQKILKALKKEIE